MTGKRPGPATALRISWLHSDPLLAVSFAPEWSLRGFCFFWLCLKHLYIHENAFTCRNSKRCYFETTMKVNEQVVCTTEPSPIAAPFVCSSLPVSLFSSAVCRHAMKFSHSFSQSWAAAFWENKYNIFRTEPGLHDSIPRFQFFAFPTHQSLNFFNFGHFAPDCTGLPQQIWKRQNCNQVIKPGQTRRDCWKPYRVLQLGKHRFWLLSKKKSQYQTRNPNPGGSARALSLGYSFAFFIFAEEAQYNLERNIQS